MDLFGFLKHGNIFHEVRFWFISSKGNSSSSDVCLKTSFLGLFSFENSFKRSNINVVATNVVEGKSEFIT